MASVVGRVGGDRRADRTHPPRAGAVGLARLGGHVAASILIGAALAAVAFVASGGSRLERTTYVEIALMLGGGAIVAAALLIPSRREALAPMHGGWSLLAFGGLTAFTAWSIVWSLAPSDSWLEANRTLGYLAVFAAGVALVRLWPARWAAVLQGVALACVAVSVWALLTKTFPGAFAETEIYARLREPFGYWNAVGLMAALGVPPLLWLAARRSGHAVVNALAWPALGLVLVCMMLAYSRGALLALAVGVAFWFAAVPLRLRGAVPLLTAIVAAAPVLAWAFSADALTQDRVPLDARIQAGHKLGVLLAAMVVVLLVAGLAVNFFTARSAPSARSRRLVGVAMLSGLALVPVAGAIALAAAPGGIDGQVSKAWDKMTNPDAHTPANTPDRLTATSSVRARYWDEAFKIHADSPWRGAGAGAYATARTHYRTGTLAVRHAHGYVAQTLADLGWVGLVLSLAALAAWLGTAVRAVGMRPLDRGLPFDAERVGLMTMIAVVLVFGVHSLVDWTWFVPANAAAGLLCAAWVVGRGPLRARLGPPAAPPASGGLRRRIAAWRPHWYRSLAAVAVLATAVAAAWAAFQPVRSVHAGNEAIARSERGALDAAASIARIAADRNPLSIEPLWDLAYIEDLRGNREAAVRELERAVHLQPASAEAWRRLGHYRLSILNRPREAREAFRAAFYLDPRNPTSTSDFLAASRALQRP